MATNPAEGLSEAPRLLQNLILDRLGGYRPWGHRVSNPLPWNIPNGVLGIPVPWGRTWVFDEATYKLGMQYNNEFVTKQLTEAGYSYLSNELPGVAVGDELRLYFLRDSLDSPPELVELGDIWNNYHLKLTTYSDSKGQWSSDPADNLQITVFPVVVTPFGKFAGKWDRVIHTMETGNNAYKFQITTSGDTDSITQWWGYTEFWVFATSYTDWSSSEVSPKIRTLVDIVDARELAPILIPNKPPLGTSYLDAEIGFMGTKLRSSKLAAYHKKRLFWTGNYNNQAPTASRPNSVYYTKVTERPKTASKIYWTDPIDLFVWREWAWIKNPALGVGEELTGMISSSMGLVIFSQNHTWIFDGDFASIQGTRLRKYPTPVGHDKEAKTAPAEFFGIAVSIWQGSIWEITGGEARDIGQPVFDPLDPFVGVITDAVDGDLIAETQKGKVYRFDIQRKSWVLVADYREYHDLLYEPEIYGLITHQPDTNNTNGWLKATSEADVVDDAFVRWEKLDFGSPNVWKQFRKAFISVPHMSDTDVLEVTGEIDGEPFTATPEYFPHMGYAQVGLPPKVGAQLTLQLRIKSGENSKLVIRPPLTIEYRLVRMR